MKRINVINESKFERMTHSELQSTKGGACLSCKKRERKIEIGWEVEIKTNTDGTGSVTLKLS
ncbi:MAG: hypothetical protein ACWA6U_12455 [Breznakibacter sp.]